MLSSQLGEDLGEEDTSSVQSTSISENTKAKLQEIIHVKNQENGPLVQDAELICATLKPLRGQLPESVKNRLADHVVQEQISKDRDKYKAQDR